MRGSLVALGLAKKFFWRSRGKIADTTFNADRWVFSTPVRGDRLRLSDLLTSVLIRHGHRSRADAYFVFAKNFDFHTSRPRLRSSARWHISFLMAEGLPLFPLGGTAMDIFEHTLI